MIRVHWDYCTMSAVVILARQKVLRILRLSRSHATIAAETTFRKQLRFNYIGVPLYLIAYSG